MGKIAMNRNAILTPRENQIAEYLAWGAAKKEVADRLTISTRTVENTARSIYEKINIQKATELCVWWFCTKCGVSWDLSPMKRIISIIILLIFIHSHVVAVHKSERYYRRTRNERTADRRRCFRNDDFNELEYY